MRDLHRHVDPDELELYAMGTSPQGMAPLIEEHLLTCEDCQERLQQSDEYVLAMGASSVQLRRKPGVFERRQGPIPYWFALAAAMACAIFLAVAVPRLVRAPAPVVAVSLTALRSDGGGNNAPSRRELVLHPDLTGLAEAPSYRLEIVDQTGHTVRQGTLGASRRGVRVPGLGSGQYFVRVYLPAGELLREYGLRIQ